MNLTELKQMPAPKLLELSQELGITMIARAKGRKFLVYNGQENFVLDTKS